MKLLVIGNALCFAGAIIMTLIGLIKGKRRFLLAQSGMNLIYIAGNLCLGGVSGAIVNLLTMARNFFCLKRNMNRGWKLAFILLNLGMTAAVGCWDFIMWLPVIGNCVFTWFIDTEDMVLLKFIVIGTQLMWFAYDLYILNFASAPFDIAAAVTN